MVLVYDSEQALEGSSSAADLSRFAKPPRCSCSRRRVTLTVASKSNSDHDGVLAAAAWADICWLWPMRRHSGAPIPPVWCDFHVIPESVQIAVLRTAGAGLCEPFFVRPAAGFQRAFGPPNPGRSMPTPRRIRQ